MLRKLPDGILDLIEDYLHKNTQQNKELFKHVLEEWYYLRIEGLGYACLLSKTTELDWWYTLRLMRKSNKTVIAMGYDDLNDYKCMYVYKKI